MLCEGQPQRQNDGLGFVYPEDDETKLSFEKNDQVKWTNAINQTP